MRWKGDGRRAGDVGAPHTFLRQTVERRGARETESVASEPVGPQRVDGDDEHVRVLAAGAGEQHRQDERSDRERPTHAWRRSGPREIQEAFALPDFPCVAL
jgi:hypothetical protein